MRFFDISHVQLVSCNLAFLETFVTNLNRLTIYYQLFKPPHKCLFYPFFCKPFVKKNNLLHFFSFHPIFNSIVNILSIFIFFFHQIILKFDSHVRKSVWSKSKLVSMLRTTRIHLHIFNDSTQIYISN